MTVSVPKTRGRKRLIASILQSWQLYVLILPAFIYVMLMSYAPMYGIQIAFKNFSSRKGIWGSDWAGLKHFARFIEYPYFYRILLNTITISLYSLATFPLPIAFALLINELTNVKFKKTLQMVTYAPHFISTVVICAMVSLFLSKNNGIINHFVAMLGGTRQDFMANPNAFVHIYVWSGVWQGLGWGTIIYLAALSNVSPELYEAAVIDGATRMKLIWHINLPSIAPTVIIMLILRCGDVVSVGFEKVYLLQNALNLEVSQVISTYVYQVGLRNGEFSYSAAISLFNTVINITLLFSVNAIAKRVSSVGIF